MKMTVYPVVEDFIQKSLTIIADVIGTFTAISEKNCSNPFFSGIEQSNREKGLICKFNAYDEMIYGVDRVGMLSYFR